MESKQSYLPAAMYKYKCMTGQGVVVFSHANTVTPPPTVPSSFSRPPPDAAPLSPHTASDLCLARDAAATIFLSRLRRSLFLSGHSRPHSLVPTEFEAKNGYFPPDLTVAVVVARRRSSHDGGWRSSNRGGGAGGGTAELQSHGGAGSARARAKIGYFPTDLSPWWSRWWCCRSSNRVVVVLVVLVATSDASRRIESGPPRHDGHQGHRLHIQLTVSRVLPSHSHETSFMVVAGKTNESPYDKEEHLIASCCTTGRWTTSSSRRSNSPGTTSFSSTGCIASRLTPAQRWRSGGWFCQMLFHKDLGRRSTR